MFCRIPQDRRTADDTRLRRMRQENVFMLEHGGRAACLLYLLVCQISDPLAGLGRVLRRTCRPTRQSQS